MVRTVPSTRESSKPVDHTSLTSLVSSIYGGTESIPFQQRVFDAIAAGRNVVLQAPTGAGKTFAALAPFVLGQWGIGSGPPALKLIYSLPLRVLAGSLRQQYQELFRKAGIPVRFTVQYGGAIEDPYLDGGAYWEPAHDGDNKDPDLRHVVFTTIDQTLSGFVGVPVGVSGRQANMLYGSVLSGALVFDEFHLLNGDAAERGWSFGTALHLLDKSPWPVLVMTATMSKALREGLCELLNAESITVEEKELPRIPSQNNTTKHLRVASAPLTGTAVVEQLGSRTLVICNRVDRAQQIYDELCTAFERTREAPKVMLLHSRFLPRHRTEKEQSLKSWFGQGSTERAVLIATQVVEAGLDISCDVMHTEISPIDSFLQRIGRAARFSGEHEAQIHVYPLADMADTLPYKPELIVHTLAALQAHQREHGALLYAHLQNLIDPILEHAQQDELEWYRANRANLDHRIHEVRWQGDPTAYRELIRDIDNVEIVVADVHKIQKSPWQYPAVSVRRSTLRGFQQNSGAIYGIVENEDRSTEEDEVGTLIQFEQLAPDQPLRGSRAIVSPASAAYSRERGLQLGKQGTFQFSPEPVMGGRENRGDYDSEPYHLHVRRIYERQEVRRAPLDALQRITWQTEDGNTARVCHPTAVIDIVIWAHDVAKLSDDWQRAHGDNTPPLAHGGRNYRPPPHALEGAYAVGDLLGHILIEQLGEDEEVWLAAFLAVATHHSSRYSPAQRTLKPYRINSARREYLRDQTPTCGTMLGSQLVKWLDEDMIWAYAGEGLHLPNTPRVAADPIYALLVYMLRRSDGLATSLSKQDQQSDDPPEQGSGGRGVRIVSPFI